MPIEQASLDSVATAYTAAMPPIRARRVHRLLLRRFARFDHVLPALAGDGAPMLLALSAAGAVAACRTTGRGPVAEVIEWAGLPGASVTTSFDLLKDSLPVVGWAIWHPSLAQSLGTVTIPIGGLSPEDRNRVPVLLAGLGA